MAKKTILVVCGGQSSEHQVSLLSARNVLEAIDRTAYDVLVAGIHKNGVWNFYPDGTFAIHPDDASKIALLEGRKAFPMLLADGPALVELEGRVQHPFDVLFPVLHGHNGEDGAIQGLCRILNCPCVGCDMTASANCMDKDIAKQLLSHNGIRVARGIVVHKGDDIQPDAVIAELGLPLVVKPSREGSSFGVSKINAKEALAEALATAFEFDTKVLIEECIFGREIECAVMGNDEPFVAVPGEIIPQVSFYSYEAKYILSDGASLQAPAPLTPEQILAVQTIAATAYRVMECRGFARVDFFLSRDGEWILNEINTIPGFTKISMFPRLMQLSGIPYADIVDRLIRLATTTP